MKTTRKLIAIVMATLLLLSCTGISGLAEENRNIVTLDVYGCLTSGLQSSWWTAKLEEELGIRLNFISRNVALYNTYLASRDLPDILILNNPEQIQNMLDAKLAVDLDTKLEMIPNILSNCTPESIDYKREAWGGFYAVPYGTTDLYDEVGSFEYGMRLHWPYFYEYIEANGYPELETLSDFLPVLKWMQDAHPTNDDGQSVYAISFMQGWGALNSAYFYIAPLYAYMQTEVVGNIEIDIDTLEYKSRYDNDSAFHEALQFLFDANNMGILDPDMINMNYGDFVAKLKAERVLSWPSYYDSGDIWRVIPYGNMHTKDYGGPALLGHYSGQCGVFVADNKNTDIALAFINYIYDYDNLMYYTYGEKGLGWDINEDGNAYHTDQWYAWQEDSTIELPGGGNPVSSSLLGNIGLEPYSTRNVHPKLGITLSDNTWVLPHGKTDNELNFEKVMLEQYGVESGAINMTDTMVVRAANGFAKYSPLAYTMSAEMDKMINSLPGQDALLKAVYCGDQAEFDAVWEQYGADCREVMNSLGWTDQMIFDAWADAYNTVVSYMK